MDKRFAVFVEGLTEQEFTIRLLTELAGKHGIEFEVHIQHKGTLSFSELRTHQTPVIHVLVANCCNDGQVKSQIIDRYNSLKSAGYSLVIGLRDVYPFTHNDIVNLENSLSIGLPPTDSLPIHLHLAIMEIEAWFIEEITHFSRIDNKITTNVIANCIGVNYACACDLPHPAETLSNIYRSVGKGYSKNKSQVQRNIDALNYEELYVNTSQKAPSLEKFISSLEAGLFKP